MKQFFKIIFYAVVFLGVSSCTVWTERQSEAVSQSVYAADDSIRFARFDLAGKYTEQAKRIVKPPKNPIEIKPFIQKAKKITSINSSTPIGNSSVSSNLNSNIITKTGENNEEETVLRLVIPEHLKSAKILIENSEEWNELLKTKEFSDQLKKDNDNLKKVVNTTSKEIIELENNRNKMITELYELKALVEKRNVHILKLYGVIILLLVSIGGGIYLRIKGIL